MRSRTQIATVIYYDVDLLVDEDYTARARAEVVLQNFDHNV